ncbi:MAG: orotidine-5'-phosphate decarboxylase [Lautropia sp.]|nr:orotidine-5'-phosphate decarboxylase [Lautropia sp.]
MSFIATLQKRWKEADSMLCVGLDPDVRRIPVHLGHGPSAVRQFCFDIIDATADLACAFKPQIAYFAALRAEDLLEELIEYIHRKYPGIPVILDAKRGDIGSTAQQYGVEAFDRYKADALTLSPFMGFDSIEPYFAWPGRGLILLCRTSNPGGDDLQALRVQPDFTGDTTHHSLPTTSAAKPDTAVEPPPAAAGTLFSAGTGLSFPEASPSSASLPHLYEHLATLAAGPWNKSGELCLVVGATYPTELARIRQLAPRLPLLVPGVGAQGGDIDATVQAGLDAEGHGLMINSSRAILYASDGTDFAAAARHVAQQTRDAIRAARDAARGGKVQR